ncbi:MAG: ATP-binding protein [Anaerolineae bacterium]
MVERALEGAKPWSQRHLVLGVTGACLLFLLVLWLRTLGHPDLPATYGSDLVILWVEPGSPGHQAGLQPGDRVFSVAGLALSSRAGLQRALARRRPDEVVPCTVQRGDEVLTVAVPLARTVPPLSLWLAWGVGLLYGAVGTWIALRHLGDPVARLLWLLGVAVMLLLGAGGSGWAWAQAVHTAAAGAIGGLLLHLAALFPEERPWFRERATWLYAPGVLGVLWGLLTRGQAPPSGGVLRLSGHPLSARVLWAWDLLCGLTALLALVQAYGRIRKPSLRRRAEWLAWSGGLALAGATAYGGSLLLQGPEELHAAIALLACAQVPLSLAAAFSQRVWSLDLVLRRAAIYSLVAVALLSGWFFMLLGAARLLEETHGAPSAATVLLLGSTLALVLLLEPARRAAERGVDRAFFRRLERWRDVLREGARELRALGRMEDVASLLTERLPRRLGVQRSCLMLFDPLEPGEASCFPQTGLDSPEGRACREVATWLRGQSALWREPMVLREWEGEGGIGQRLAPWLEAGWEVCLPLVHRGDWVGLWLLGNLEGGRPYGPAEVDLLAQVREEAAAAVANAMLYEDLLDLTRQLEARVEERTRELTGLLGRMAHALATPATSIHGFAELLAATAPGLDAQAADHLRAIERHGRQLLALGRDMRIVALLASGHIHPRLEAVDAGRLVQETVQEFLPEARAAGVRLAADLPAADVFVQADQGYLYRALRVLVQNAVHYTPAGGSVQVRVRVLPRAPEALRMEGPAVEIAVADTGFGIPEDERVHIFDAFFRGQDERVRARPGNGLGLTVAKGLVEVQGGSLTCESEVGRGSIFRVVLPQATPPEHST